ncbi:MAG TPA: AAA family ATPase [Gemmatimonadales bacterium]|nr:AAA family ATPase [Gemmatimonadales bacterium]
MPPLSELHLVTLGHCAIERRPEGAAGETIFGPGKPFAVLAYLAAAPHRTTRREQLLDLLWADTDPDKARNSLRQVIWLLRSRLGDEVLSADGDRISLHRSVVADRDEFLAAVNSGDPASALAVYGGPFLPDLASPGGAEFDHWADVEREHLHTAYVRAAELRARQLLDGGHAHQAVEIAEQLRARGPLREASWRLLIEALLAGRNTLAATAQADGLVRMLQAEGRSPEPASQRLVARCDSVHGKQHPDGHRDSLVAELIGREAEFSAAVRLWREVTQGRARHLHLSAEAGLGKSRLIADITARIRAQGGRVVMIRGRAGERNVAWMIAADLARALADLPGAKSISPSAAGTLVAMEPSLAPRFPGAADPGSWADDPLRHRAGALRELLAAVTLDGPLALAIDDVHWVDRMSGEAIGLALTRVSDRPILVLSAARPAPETAPIAPPDARAELAPLTASQLSELLASLGALPPVPWAADLVDHLCRTTDGSPLLVLESVTALIGRQLLQLDDQGWAAADPDTLLRVASAPIGFGERVARLPAHARAVLDAIAVAPIPLPLAPLGHALGRPPAVLAAALEELEREGMVLRREGAWEPAHDRVRERAIALMTPEGRDRLACAVCRDAGIDAEVPDRLLPALAPVLANGNDVRGLERIYHRWLGVHRAQGDRRSDRALARDLLGAGASPDALRRLLNSRPLARRVGGVRALVAGLGALLILGGWGMRDWAGRPVRLALVVAPAALGANGVTMGPAPVVDIQDRLGHRVMADSAVVVIAWLGSGHLAGDTTVTAVRGRAVFANVYADRPGSADTIVFLRFSSPGLVPAVDTLYVGNSTQKLTVRDGTLNGQPLGADDPIVRVHQGDTVTGVVRVHYVAHWPAAAVMLGAIATWLPGPEGVVAQTPIVTPTLDGSAVLPLSFRAPPAPGTYHLVLVYQAEPDVKWIASGTNWLWEHPVWGDGNDVREWSDSMLAVARATGQVASWIIRRDPEHPEPEAVPSRVVDVVVR